MWNLIMSICVALIFAEMLIAEGRRFFRRKRQAEIKRRNAEQNRRYAEILTKLKTDPSSSYAFCGADMVVYFNDKAIGELESLNVTENFSKDIVEGNFTVGLFKPEDAGTGHRFRNVTKIDVKLCDEYGKQSGFTVSDVEVISCQRSMSVHDIVLGHQYIFKAAYILPLKV